MKEKIFMGPRVFISSTFYDLKYARETIDEFIQEHGFESIRSETGDIGYITGKNLDISCYEAMSEADMAILIVGGRYGSPASNSKETDDKFNKYISVTRKEFDTAIINNIPIFVFIDSHVHQEYRMYKNNKEEFEREDCKIQFSVVDNINVHRFIESISLLPKVPVYDFSNISEIKEVLRKQWADMIRIHLLSIKRNTSINQIEKSIENVYSTVMQMDIMLNEMGKIAIDDSNIYDKIVIQQRVEYAASVIANTFEFVSKLKNVNDIKSYLKFFVYTLFDAYKKDILEYPFSENFEDVQKFYEIFNTENVLLSSVKEHISFESDIFIQNDDFKNQLIDRLLKKDFLEKMGLDI